MIDNNSIIDLKYWTLCKDNDQIIWSGLNRQDLTVNALNNLALDELNNLLHDIARDKEALGVIIYSLKKIGFIAGADINEFAHFSTHDVVLDFLKKGHAVFAKLEKLSIPTVALIHGFCLGGGLELALACRYRIAATYENSIFGFPEILLGIHPGWGGTVRLTRLIGGINALSKLILTGRPLSSTKAKYLGIVDEIVPSRQLKVTAVHYIKTQPPLHKRSWLQSIDQYLWVRKIAACYLRYQINKRIDPSHYPAPNAAITVWQDAGGIGERAYQKEIDSVENLVKNSMTAKNLTHIFLMRERLKSYSHGHDFHAKHVHVIGAGTMGGDIAAWCSLQGMKVTLQDKTYSQIAPAIARAQVLFNKKISQPHLIQAAMDRLIVDPIGYGITKADIIIEAVSEDLSIKQAVIREIELTARKEAMIATNTSSIPLNIISQVMIDSKRLIGMHFFNPVAKMELVEIVIEKTTSKIIAKSAGSFINSIGKLPLVVKSSPGFLINRILVPYLMECILLLEEGYSKQVIDASAKAFGMLMGPVELIDTIGLDICLAVSENLLTNHTDHIPQSLRDKINHGQLGKKVGRGFYRYQHGKPVKSLIILEKPNQEITDRLILRMISESWKCLDEKVVADADLLDIGMILGTGFAPFRGGVIRYANHFGTEKLQILLAKLASKYGERF